MRTKVELVSSCFRSLSTCIRQILLIFSLHGVTIAVATTSIVSVSVGQTATLLCKTDGIASYLVMWLDEDGRTLTQGTELQTSDKRFSVLNPYRNEWNLRIQSVRAQDSGTYQCFITLAGKTERQYQVTLRILVPPSITKVSSDVTVATGDDVTLTCIATGTPQPNVTWHLNRRLTMSREVTPMRVDGVEGGWILTSVDWTMAGQYECKADNGVQPAATASFRVDVTCPPTVQIPYRVVRQSLGSQTLLQCIVTGYPAPQVHWEVKGQPVLPALAPDKYRVQEYSVTEYRTAVGLVVSDLTSEDCTVYSCMASSASGQASEEVSISAWRTELLVASIGQTFSIPCPLSKELVNTSKLVTWYYREQVLYSPTTGASNPRYTSDTDGGLTIASIVVDDAGEYRCEIPVLGQQSVHITVTDGATECSSVGGGEAALGRAFGLTCALTYYGHAPRWRVTWTHEPSDLKYDGIVKPLGVWRGQMSVEELNTENIERKMEGNLLLQARQELSGRFRCDVTCMECESHSNSFRSCSYDVILMPSSASSCSASESDVSMTTVAIVSVIFLIVIMALAAVIFLLIRKYKRELSVVPETTGQRKSSAGSIQPKSYRQSFIPTKSVNNPEDELPAVS